MSALKARLAKKGADAAPEAPPAAPVELPPPGEVAVPASELSTEAAPAVVDEPEYRASSAAPPGERPPPRRYEPEPDLAEVASAGGYEGDIKPRSSMGLILLAGVGALAFGLAAGYLSGVRVAKSAKLADAEAKSREIAEQINLIKEGRSRISLGIEDVKTKMMEDPTKGAEAVAALGKHLEGVDTTKLFGWQMAYMGDPPVKKVEQLYREAHGLRRDIAELEEFVTTNGQALATGGAPVVLAVVTTEQGAVLVQVGQLMCGEAPCAPDKRDTATGVEIYEQLGGEAKIIPKDQAKPVMPDGPVFKYAIMDNPSRTAFDEYARLMQQIATRLETMNEAEKDAIDLFEKHGAIKSGGGAGEAG